MILYVLIACEESQAECAAFRALGHVAYSCDIVKVCRGGNPAWHICSDVRPYLRGRTSFITQDGVSRNVPRWDLIIAHPPCTYLCRLSGVQLMKYGTIDYCRLAAMYRARQFFMECLAASAKYVAVENPVPMTRACLPRPTTYVCPSWFGDRYTKKTCYWLKNLPPLFAQVVNGDAKSLVRCTRGKYRSRTSKLLAAAIAYQWSAYIESQEGGL